ncbi:MAG: hypothetical protein IPM98_21890 [Lewinellaceae bacterium]|nr:hypothetical protein [Lewinellaceae bacterium]
MRLLLFFLVCLWSATAVSAQKFIQLEKANRARTTKFYVGQELTYRLKGEKEWHTSTITNAQMDSQLVALDLKPIRVAEIDAIRLQYPTLLRKAGSGLMIFGASWAGFSLIGAAFDNYELTASTAIVSGTGLVSGFLLHQIFKNKNVKLGTRKRLRAVEIPVTFQR